MHLTGKIRKDSSCDITMSDQFWTDGKRKKPMMWFIWPKWTVLQRANLQNCHGLNRKYLLLSLRTWNHSTWLYMDARHAASKETHQLRPRWLKSNHWIPGSQSRTYYFLLYFSQNTRILYTKAWQASYLFWRLVNLLTTALTGYPAEYLLASLFLNLPGKSKGNIAGRWNKQQFTAP